MEENLLDQDETNEIPVLKILTKREGDKLLVANAGCHSLIGTVTPANGRFYVDSHAESFRTEREAIEFLIK